MDSPCTALLLIDVQEGFKAPIWGKRNNPNAEQNIKTILEKFRNMEFPVVHVQHLSTNPYSPLRPGQEGANFMAEANPLQGERVFQKQVNSAFVGTDLDAYLRDENIRSLVMVGFTSDHCVSTSARMGANLGFEVTVISDATVTFERQGSSGEIFPAELVHEVNLASLRGEFATVITTADIIFEILACGHTNFTNLNKGQG